MTKTTVLQPMTKSRLSREETADKVVVAWRDFSTTNTVQTVYDDATQTIALFIDTDHPAYEIRVTGRMVQNLGEAADKVFAPTVFAFINAVSLPKNWWQAAKIVSRHSRQPYKTTSDVWNCPLGNALKQQSKEAYELLAANAI